jgi:hypothetical protein
VLWAECVVHMGDLRSTRTYNLLVETLGAVKQHFGHIGVDMWVILKWALKVWNMKLWDVKTSSCERSIDPLSSTKASAFLEKPNGSSSSRTPLHRIRLN